LLKISRMINRNTANKRINTAINTVVPQPGNTLPASEFNGLKRVPNGVTIPGSWKEEPLDWFDLAFDVPVAIFFIKNYIFFTFCNIIIFGEYFCFKLIK
jgi:hypothetical protein